MVLVGSSSPLPSRSRLPAEDHGHHVDEADDVDLLVREDPEALAVGLDGTGLVRREVTEGSVEALPDGPKVVAEDDALARRGLIEQPNDGADRCTHARPHR